MNALRNTDHMYLIIGGTSKAATTSLFDYLADHPQICAAREKETRFFLDKDYPLPAKHRYEEGINKYFNYYTCQNNEQIRLEATPDYLYSPNTASSIKDALTNVKSIFILRDPLSRLISWFKFGKMLRKLPNHMTFDEYVNCQRNKAEWSQKKYNHPVFFALEQGKYSNYLESYFSYFDKENIHVCFYEDFLENPVSFMTSICEFVDIRSKIYNNYEFKPTNKSSNIRSTLIHNLLYFGIISRLQNYVNDKKKIRVIFKKIRYRFEPIYYKFNVKLSEDIEISESTKRFLKEYYSAEFPKLTRMIGKAPPW